MQDLEKLALEVAEDQKGMVIDQEDTRDRVYRMGRNLNKAFETHRKREAKKPADQRQTWREWVEEQKSARPTFPVWQDAAKYRLVQKWLPKGHYATDGSMSIKAAYKLAGEWKKANGEPIKLKTTVSARRLPTIARIAGKLSDKIEKLTDIGIMEAAEEEEWNEDDLAGAMDELKLVRQAVNGLLKQLAEIEIVEESDA